RTEGGRGGASGGAGAVWRVGTPARGEPVAKVGAHSGPAHAVQFNPAGTILATSGDDGTVKFWQLPVPADRVLPPQGDAITALTLSADGAQVFAGGADKLIRQIGFAKGDIVRQFPGATGAITSLAVAPTAIAAGTTDQRLLLWNAADGKLISQGIAHQGPVTGVAFHPQGTQLLTGGGDGLLKLWALPAVPTRVLAHPEAVLTATLSADNKKLITGSNDKNVRIWNPANNQNERQVPRPARDNA